MRYDLKARLLRLWTNEQGFLTAVLAGAGLLGNLFSKGAESSAKGRAAESQLLMQQDQLRNQQYGIGQNAQMQAGQLDLDRKRFSEDARGGRAKQAVLADILMNFKPTQVSVPGITPANISGGIQIGDGAKASLGELYKQALAAQLAGDTFTGGNILNAPQLSQLPKASGWEKFMGIAGTIGNLAGGIGSMIPQSGSQPQGLSQNVLNVPNVRF